MKEVGQNKISYVKVKIEKRRWLRIFPDCAIWNNLFYINDFIYICKQDDLSCICLVLLLEPEQILSFRAMASPSSVI